MLSNYVELRMVRKHTLILLRYCVNDLVHLRTFANKLSNAEVTLKSNDMFPEMDTQSNIVQIYRRLVPELRYK